MEGEGTGDGAADKLIGSWRTEDDSADSLVLGSFTAVIDNDSFHRSPPRYAKLHNTASVGSIYMHRV